MKRRWWRILTLMQAVLLTGMPVQAAADRMLQVQSYSGDYCYVESSGASTIRGAQMAGLCEIDSVYKDVGNLAYLNLGVGTFRNGLYGLVLSKRDYASLLAVHERCQAWLRGHMEEIVPEGTPWRAAITLCADWIAPDNRLRLLEGGGSHPSEHQVCRKRPAPLVCCLGERRLAFLRHHVLR